MTDLTAFLRQHPLGQTDLNAETVLARFRQAGAWEARYRELILLGKQLPAIPAEWRGEEQTLAGCESQVWIVMAQSDDGTIELRGDSDAAIVKGLIAVVFSLYQQMSAQDIVAFDVRPWFEKMALTQHLTPSRSQGLEAMIRAIRAKAAILS